jgi:DNA-directed RNA polymerase specialized sigma24 family protein
VEGRPLDEAELIARARRGDEEAYAALVTQHSDIAFRTAYLVTGSATEAEEATQDGFLNTQDGGWTSIAGSTQPLDVLHVGT